MLQFVIAWLFPFFETSGVFVTNVVALGALDDIPFFAVLGLMTNFVALETHFLVAVE